MVKEFIKELEKQLQLDEPLRPEAEGVYALAIDEGVVVSIVDTKPGYSFQCHIGECPTKNTEDFFTKALRADLYGQATEGAVIGLNGEGTHVILTFENPRNQDSFKVFKENLEDYLNVLDYWRAECKK